jgi:hypothetical protein
MQLPAKGQVIFPLFLSLPAGIEKLFILTSNFLAVFTSLLLPVPNKVSMFFRV